MCTYTKKAIVRSSLLSDYTQLILLFPDANSLRSKNKECGAKLTVRIKYNTKDVRYKDKYVKEGYMGIININFVHSHSVNNAESWRWLRAPEIKDK